VADGAEKPLGDQQQSQTAPRPTRWSLPAAVLVLAALVVGVFYPLWGYDFIDYDTFPQVVVNQHVHGLTRENVKHILTSRCIHSYYPVRSLTYAVDYELWGLTARGFKLTNVLIHFANVLLVFWLVLRLFGGESAESAGPAGRRWEVSVAAAAAGIAAVHPVMVEPVAWIPGREELLMTLGALATVHFHLTARRRAAAKRTWASLAYHAAAAVACAAACLSNAVGAVIPMLAVVCDVVAVRQRRPAKIVLGTALLWAIAIATVLGKRLGPGTDVATAGQFSLGGRLWIGLSAYWLDLKSLFWPADLALYYDWLFPDGLFDPNVLLGIAAAAVTAGLVWVLRRRPVAVFGIAWWCVALAPSLQIFPHHIHRADRFMYLPMMGLAVAVAAIVRPLGARYVSRAVPAAVGVAAAALLLVLAAVSSRQVQTWRDSYTAWQRCIDTDADNTRAMNVLGDILAKEGRAQEAFEQYEKVMKISPKSVENLGDYARELTLAEGKDRDSRRAVELAAEAYALTGEKCPERRHILVAALCARAVDLQQQGEYAQAIETYGNALRTDPRSPLPSLNLGLLLAICPEARFRSPQEALRLAEGGLRNMKTPDVNAFVILAATYAAVGRYQAAVTATEKAITIAEQSEGQEDPARLRRNLDFYQTLARQDGTH